MKRYLRMLTTAVALLAASNCVAQNFIKTDLAFSFDDSKKLVQTFDFNLNRTDEVQNKNGGVLHHPDGGRQYWPIRQHGQ
jgi:hypothetical protein